MWLAHAFAGTFHQHDQAFTFIMFIMVNGISFKSASAAKMPFFRYRIRRNKLTKLKTGMFRTISSISCEYGEGRLLGQGRLLKRIQYLHNLCQELTV